MPPKFSVVVPVYNEAEFLPLALPALIEAMESVEESYEILIVENGSDDGSAAIAESIAASAPVSVLSLQIADYGSAMHHGFSEATGDWVVNFDIDYFSAEFLRKVLGSDSFDIVIGSKRDPDSEDLRPPVRRLATRVFNLLLRTILGSRVSDTHGMKAFRRELVEDLNPRVVSRQDLYDTELVIRAERAGYRIAEVPVVVEELRTAKSSLVKRVPRTVAGLFRIRKLLTEPVPSSAGQQPPS
ncbi:MAG: glycosyltransferase family 2 protein [Acidimicrobiia bacterium]